MPVRAVCKPHSPDLKRGALATDARGCSLWRSLLERPPPAPMNHVQESRVRDPLRRVVAVWTRGVTQAQENTVRRDYSHTCMLSKKASTQQLLKWIDTRTKTQENAVHHSTALVHTHYTKNSLYSKHTLHTESVFLILSYQNACYGYENVIDIYFLTCNIFCCLPSLT